MKHKSYVCQHHRNHEKGAVALEYLLVTTFATILSVALLGVSWFVVEHKIGELGEKLHMDLRDHLTHPLEP